MKTTHSREYAEEYWQLKRGIRLAHKRGDYHLAAVIRTVLNLTFDCWLYQRGFKRDSI